MPDIKTKTNRTPYEILRQIKELNLTEDPPEGYNIEIGGIPFEASDIKIAWSSRTTTVPGLRNIGGIKFRHKNAILRCDVKFYIKIVK